MDEAVPFGEMLRRWRLRRHLTQTDLALSMDSSTRHLSCLETGRAQPSRDMVLRLCEHLDVPLRDRNLLLLAASFAPAFQERSLAELAAARTAMEQILQAHMPYPAFALDRHWNIVLSNGALPQLYEGCSPDLLQKPVNAVRLILHPLGMGPRVVNFSEWRAHTISVLRQQVESKSDPAVETLLAEVISYRSPGGALGLRASDTAHSFATPLKVETRLGTVSFLSTTTVFGTPTDVTLSELALEMLFPADESTVAVVESMIAETRIEARKIHDAAAKSHTRAIG
jgi:transcriptional regulator with XRE-family HTH domain